MENLTLDQLNLLAQQTAGLCVSIYLPTRRAGQDTQQNSIRFKNLLRDAEKRLLSLGMGPRQVDGLLKPAQALVYDAYFWSHQYDGLAVLTAPEDFHTYRLPFRVEERLVIARSYYVKPVLPLFTNNGHYFILAISQDQVRLYEGTRHTVGQIDLPEGTPQSLEETLSLDHQQKYLQFRTAVAQGGMRASIFHGQGPGAEEQKVWIENYLNRVDRALEAVFRRQHAPLVLAGVDYLLPIYRKVSGYGHILRQGITGSPEHMRPEELQERAWGLVAHIFQQELDETLEQYRRLAGAGKAANAVEEVAAAAHHGRVEKLVLSVEAQAWGSFDPDSGEVKLDPHGAGSPDRLELFDFAAMKTLQNGGVVYGLSQAEMPADSPVAAAILRY